MTMFHCYFYLPDDVPLLFIFNQAVTEALNERLQRHSIGKSKPRAFHETRTFGVKNAGPHRQLSQARTAPCRDAGKDSPTRRKTKTKIQCIHITVI